MKEAFFIALAGLYVCASATNAAITTHFTSTDIGAGLYGSAVATVTTGAGYVDVAIQNTSSLGQIDDDWATPYITELKLTFPDDQMVDVANSHVHSLAGSCFGQGAGEEVLYSDSTQTLNYTLVEKDDPKGKMKKCPVSYAKAVNNGNDNTIASMNILDGSLVPQEDRATGFLNPVSDPYSGAVFGTVVFHFEFTDELYHVQESFYEEADTLVVKYQGGGDYSYRVSSAGVHNVPEPATLTLVVIGSLAMTKLRRRI